MFGIRRLVYVYGVKLLVFGFWYLGYVFGVWCLVFGVWYLGCGVQGVGVQGLWFRISGPGFGIWS
jgi:hypothetical protein